MALIDLSSDLSKFRSTVKSTNETTPETSRVKDSRSFGAVLPITEKILQFSPPINKTKETNLESKLPFTRQDDIVKRMKEDLIINSVSKYSPLNASKDRISFMNTPLESVVSKFAAIQREELKTRLDKSDVLIIRKESGTNNLSSPIDVNTLLAKSIDRRNTSPDVFRINQTDNKVQFSPDILSDKNTPSDNIQNPNVVINKPSSTTNLEVGSADINRPAPTPDKSVSSPTVNLISQSNDKSVQSPNVNSVIQISDKENQSPDVNSFDRSSDKENQGPDPIVPIQYSDKSEQSPSVFSNSETPDKSISSPNIKPIPNDASDNITNPNVEVFGRTLVFDRQGQSAIINKDLISPINNVVNPNIALDQNVLTFDRQLQSPNIFKNVKQSGFVTNPDTKVFKIEQGTNHLQDQSNLNLDGLPVKFVANSRLVNKQTFLQKDNPRFNPTSIQTKDNSRLNIDGETIPKTNPSGRNENPEKSKLAIKGMQSVNFFQDLNANGFTIKAQKGITNYKQNSDLQWNGGRQNAPTVNFFSDSNASGFTKFMLETKYKLGASKLDWDGNRESAPSAGNFKTFVQTYQSNIVNNSSLFKWEGNKQAAPKTDFFSNENGVGFTTFMQKFNTELKPDSSEFVFKGSLPSPVNFLADTHANGFLNKATPLVTSYKKDSSRFTFKGTSKSAPSTNYFEDEVNNGFTNFARPLQTEFKRDASIFSFKGSRQQAPSVDYFTNVNGDGFRTFTESLGTSYKKETSRFTWVGTRQQAPEVDFFKIPNAVSGFTKFFVDKTTTKLSDEYSRLSFAGTTVRSAVKPVPYTSFFGYSPSERSGFMVDMSTFDGTLYPNIAPTLKYNADGGSRYSIEQARAIRGGMRTNENEKWAPKSLGPRPWIDGTLSSTLESQIPDGQIKTGASAGSYFSKYETSLKDKTDGMGFVGKWAITRRSPSPLDLQYNKFSLQKDSFNNDIVGAFRQPYIVRGIQRDGQVENQRWGFGVTFDDGLIRGGAATHAERVAADAERLFKWTASMKGILFNAKQVGLQLMNPNVDRNPRKGESSFIGLSATQIYNPILNPILINTVTARTGLHIPRHSLFPFSSNFLNKYEDATLDRESNSKFIDPDYNSFQNLKTPSFANRQTNYNRLIGLMKELLPNSFQQVRAPSETGDPIKNSISRAALGLAKELTGQSGITRLSSNFGGPQSFLGIGGTQINRAKHPYLTHYTTTPLLMLTGEQKEPQYQESAKRDTFYAATAMYKDLFGDILKTIAYNLPSGPYEMGGENSSRQMSKVTNLQPSDINRIEKQNPFEPKYDLFKNRLRAISAVNVQRSSNISDQVHPDNIDSLNPIKQYRALNYDKLGVSRDRRRSRNNSINAGDLNDFREDLFKDSYLKNFSTDPSVSDYANQNLEDKFGFGKHGKVGVDRSNPSVNNIRYGRSADNYPVPKLKDGGEFRGDRINIIDYKRAKFNISKDLVYEKGKYNDQTLPGADDLIEFYFTGVILQGSDARPAEAIVFRATFGNISDSHNAEWTPIDYLGRADPLFVYKGYNRQISFDFSVQITSRDEMKASWRKLNHLASWTTPEYTKSGFMRAPIIRLNIGNLYRKMPGFLSNITYNFDNTEITWETAQLKYDQTLTGPDGRSSSPGVLQLPKLIRVNCEFTPIGMYRPEYNGVMYSLYDDTNGGDIETGLIPKSDTKVNYFRSYEVDSTGNNESGDSPENMRYYRIKPGEETTIPDVIPDDVASLGGTSANVPENKTSSDVPTGVSPFNNTNRSPLESQA